MFEIQAKHCGNRATLNANGKSISGFLFAVEADAHQALGDNEVARGTDRKVFGDAFDDAQDQCLQNVHRRGQ